MKKIAFLLTFLLTVSFAYAQKENKDKSQAGSNNTQSAVETKKSDQSGGNKTQSVEETKKNEQAAGKNDNKPQDTRFQAGASGVKRSIAYRFSPSVSGNPADGIFRFDNASVNKVTYLIVNDKDISGEDQGKWYKTWDDTTGAMARGQITLVNNDGKNAVVFDVTGLFADAAGYWRIPVRYISGSLPAEGDTYYYIFERIDHKKDPIAQAQPEQKPAEEPKPPVVEQKPAEEPKPPVVEQKPAEEPKPPVVEQKPAEEPKPPVVEQKPAEEPKPPVVEQKPAEEPKPPVVEQKPAEEPKPPVVEQKPAEEPKPPVVEQKPAEEPKPPVVEQKPAEEPKPPVVEQKPAEEPKPPVVEQKPAEEPKPPVVEQKPAEEPKPPVVEPTPVVPEEKPVEQTRPATRRAEAEAVSRKQAARETATANQPEQPANKPAETANQPTQAANQPVQKAGPTFTSQVTQGAQPEQNAAAPPSYQSNLPQYQYRYSTDRRARGKWYAGIIEAGYGLGVGEYGMDNFRFNFINGFHIGETFSIGLGIGMRRYYPEHKELSGYSPVSGKVQVPVFLDLRKTFSTRKVTPYLALGLGNSARLDSRSDSTIYEGLLFNPSGGIWFNISRRFAVFAGVAYEMQKMEFVLLSDDSRFRKNANSVSLNLGIAF